ncbi:nectin-3-like protein isoform X1 [Lates japonicus]|uniref:Nectin-3-like protein isoform X1 n=1 Tax=Lates japonicus TaxID=270547 RepID=A0AAD3MH97_LATJO|nr:nectin-3-like protein isoform X1 [Lates japonicus]
MTVEWRMQNPHGSTRFPRSSAPRGLWHGRNTVELGNVVHAPTACWMAEQSQATHRACRTPGPVEVFRDGVVWLSEKQSHDEPNSTTTAHVRYMWQPQSYA